MRRLVLPLLMTVLCFSFTSCKGSHEKVVTEEIKGAKAISSAETEVQKQKIESKEEIHQAQLDGSLKKVEAEKIKATKDIAAAEAKVDEKKIDATEAVSEAKQKAGESTGSLQHDK